MKPAVNLYWVPLKTQYIYVQAALLNLLTTQLLPKSHLNIRMTNSYLMALTPFTCPITMGLPSPSKHLFPHMIITI